MTSPQAVCDVHPVTGTLRVIRCFSRTYVAPDTVGQRSRYNSFFFLRLAVLASLLALTVMSWRYVERLGGRRPAESGRFHNELLATLKSIGAQ